MKKHYLIIIPGIPSFGFFIKIITTPFYLFGYIPYVVDIRWTDEEDTFHLKLKRLLQVIDSLSQKGDVSLIGLSAGGSIVLNVLLLRKSKVQRVITICSRWKKFNGELSEGMKKHRAFCESVEQIEKNGPLLTSTERVKILTIRALYDEMVNPRLIPFPGATNICLPLLFHGPTIIFSLSLFSYVIFRFIKTNKHQ